MNIVYIAYSCSPSRGSEEKIGWNVPLESAKSNQVIVITKEEHRRELQEYLLQHSVENISFEYVDIPGIYKKIFKGSLYSGRLNIWQKKAYCLVKKICAEKDVDIIHQITPVEFRSIGQYGKIPEIRYVCGPLGGGEYIPKELRSYMKEKFPFELLRTAVNLWYRMKYRITNELCFCDCVLFANHETKEFLSSIIKEDYKILTEIGIDNSLECSTIVGSYEKCTFIMVGRLVYRKGHALLLDALARIPKELDYECRIIGNGPDMKKLREKCSINHISDRVKFVGEIPHTEINQEYQKANVFILPSLRETTGSVLLEAMANGLPIVTMDRFGSNILVNENIGWFYNGETKEEIVEDLKNVLIHCIQNKLETVEKGKNAFEHVKNHTWKNKLEVYNSIYKEIVNDEK